MTHRANFRCDSIRDSVVSFLVGNTSALNVGQACVVTLPVLTVDGRWADVFIESRMKNSLIVHDNGKASAEMFLQGAAITDKVHRDFTVLAKKYEVQYSRERERFEAVCKVGEAENSIIRIGTCSAVASRNLLELKIVAEQESTISHVRDFLTHWKSKHPKIGLSEGDKFAGVAKQHTFEFVLHPPGFDPVAVAVLSPTVSGLNTAERFGFKIQDLRAAKANFKSIAVRTKLGEWSKSAIKVVDHFADLVMAMDLKQRSLPTSEQELSRFLSAA